MKLSLQEKILCFALSERIEVGGNFLDLSFKVLVVLGGIIVEINLQLDRPWSRRILSLMSGSPCDPVPVLQTATGLQFTSVISVTNFKTF